jgi:hypothetical protein
MPAAIGARLEILTHVIRRKEGDAARPAMHKSRLDGPRHIRLAGQVGNRIVDEHRVELSIQPNRAHVADMMLALRVEFAAVREHAI